MEEFFLKTKKKNEVVNDFIAALILLVALGCQCNSDLFNTKKSDSVSNTKSSTTDKQNDSSLAKSIVGTWKEEGKSEEMAAKYTFSSNGEFVLKEEGTQRGTYKILDEETMEIHPTEGISKKMNVKIKGDTMTTDYEGEIMTFKKGT